MTTGRGLCGQRILQALLTGGSVKIFHQANRRESHAMHTSEKDRPVSGYWRRSLGRKSAIKHPCGRNSSIANSSGPGKWNVEDVLAPWPSGSGGRGRWGLRKVVLLIAIQIIVGAWLTTAVRASSIRTILPFTLLMKRLIPQAVELSENVSLPAVKRGNVEQQPQFYVLDNGYLRFGNGQENSINSQGSIQKLFY